MQTIVDPHGPRLLNLPSNPVPDGARAGYFETSDGVRLRYGLWPRRSDPHRGTICLLQGRTEFIEKYFETIADFQRRGFAVATFDWRGQGGSDRLIADRRWGHVERFSDYWSDLASFHRRILLPDCPGPFYLVGHSMGGLAGLMGAVNDRMMFERVLLSAPMLGLERTGLSMHNTALVMEILAFFGFGGVPVGRHAEMFPTRVRFKGNPLTADLRRYMRMVDVIAANPDLAIGRPTVRWLGAAARTMAETARDDFPARLRVPLLMLAAGADNVVSTPAIEQLGLRLRTGRHLVIPAARHELFMETDGVRGQVLAAFDSFITDQSS